MKSEKVCKSVKAVCVKYFWNRLVLSLEWNSEGATDGEWKWSVQNEVNVEGWLEWGWWKWIGKLIAKAHVIA